MSKDIKLEDVHLHCRCCLNKFAAGGRVNTNEMPRQLFQLFRYCTGFRIWQKGLYPEFMCEPCHELLKSFERFEKQCKRSSCILEELLNGHRIDQEVVTESMQLVKNEEITPILRSNQVPANEEKALASLKKTDIQLKDSLKDGFPFENIEVKPEIENEHNIFDDGHLESDLEDYLALSEADDEEELKSESNRYIDAANEHIKNSTENQNESQFRCEKCDKVFTNLLKLKQHKKKIHTDEILNASNEIHRSRKTTKFETLDQENELSSLQDTELPTPQEDVIKVSLPYTLEPSSQDVVFENVVVEPKLEDLIQEPKQDSDSDFEDSLTLTELRKSTGKLKGKKSAKFKAQKRSSSALNSENETFGPVKQEKPKVVCDQCPRKFKWPFELRRHIKEMHGDKPLELPCKYNCGKVFNSQNTLKSHYRIKHQMKKQIYRENAYICEQCGKGFKRLPLLERHRFHHLPPEARPFKCEQCGKTFVMERIYKEHLLRHSGNKKYECSYCGIKKATLGEYREHINIHTKEKEYACELCSKIFYRSKNLVQHVSAVHQGIKKHFCRFCQHSFANHINLVHHERIHTGEKPYSCEICKRSFIQPSALKTHMKTHDETRIKAKVGRKPKNQKAKEEFDFETIMDDNLQQQINNYN